MNTMQSKSVKSLNPFKSVIQTTDDMVKAHGGELKVESLPADQRGTTFRIILPIN